VAEDLWKLYEGYFTRGSVGRVSGLRRLVESSILASMGYDGSQLKRVLGTALSWIGPLKEAVELSVMTLDGRMRGKLLDVGCGDGRFLAKMRDLGWEVTGVEPDGLAVEVARERFGLDVHRGTLEDIRFPERTFDVVTMNHVIEHVPDPVGTLEECLRVLKPGGRLVVTTPNVESLGHRLFGKRWFHLDPPRHLYLFSARSLLMCAERAGLRVTGFWTSARSARWMWAVSWAIRWYGTLPGGPFGRRSLWLRLSGLAFHAAECSLVWTGYIGEELVFTATR